MTEGQSLFRRFVRSETKVLYRPDWQALRIMGKGVKEIQPPPLSGGYWLHRFIFLVNVFWQQISLKTAPSEAINRSAADSLPVVSEPKLAPDHRPSTVM